MKKLLKEFKEFALKGNVIDMAIGVIVGASFSAIVNSLTDNFIKPLISVVTGGVTQGEDGTMQIVGGSFKIRGVEFNYGAFLSEVINFLLVAFVLFIILKAINGAAEAAKKIAKKEEEEAAAAAAEPEVSEEVLLLRDIKELLAEKK